MILLTLIKTIINISNGTPPSNTTNISATPHSPRYNYLHPQHF